MDKFKREKRNLEILTLHNQGVTMRKIAELVNLSKTGVHKIIHRFSNPEFEVSKSPSININSLRDIAIYLEGIKEGKGNLYPLGTTALDDLWSAIKFLKDNQIK